MSTHVINIRTAGDTPYIYIGRAMPRYGLKASIYGNPWKARGEGERASAVNSYRLWLNAFDYDDLRDDEQRLAIIESIPDLAKQMLAGKKLACWCAPKECHGEVLIELVEQYLGHKLPVEARP